MDDVREPGDSHRGREVVEDVWKEALQTQHTVTAHADERVEGGREGEKET